MTDPFATLHQPRRPWLDLVALKDQFHALTAHHHPDAAGGDNDVFSAITQAYKELADPAIRLKRLLDLEYPEAFDEPAKAIAPSLANRFMEIATLRRELDVYLNQQPDATTALTKALQASERFSLKMDLEKALTSLQVEYDRSLELLKAEDDIWDQRTPSTGPRLGRLANELSYLGKWIGQLREGIMRLDG
ncbi:MAG: hypothetical protein ACO1QR_05850, partial [Chthoniobacteraceae bacterium]